jgi:hypothetical protein
VAVSDRASTVPVSTWDGRSAGDLTDRDDDPPGMLHEGRPPIVAKARRASTRPCPAVSTLANMDRIARGLLAYGVMVTEYLLTVAALCGVVWLIASEPRPAQCVDTCWGGV